MCVGGCVSVGKKMGNSELDDVFERVSKSPIGKRSIQQTSKICSTNANQRRQNNSLTHLVSSIREKWYRSMFTCLDFMLLKTKIPHRSTLKQSLNWVMVCDVQVSLLLMKNLPDFFLPFLTFFYHFHNYSQFSIWTFWVENFWCSSCPNFVFSSASKYSDILENSLTLRYLRRCRLRSLASGYRPFLSIPSPGPR